jgi:hypothetical protein
MFQQVFRAPVAIQANNLANVNTIMQTEAVRRNKILYEAWGKVEFSYLIVAYTKLREIIAAVGYSATVEKSIMQKLQTEINDAKKHLKKVIFP